jgi:hypothetical protein
MRLRGGRLAAGFAWGVAALAGSLLHSTPAGAQQQGVKLVGRWLHPDAAPIATYAGSMVRLSFSHSSGVSADLTVLDSRGNQYLYVSISIDGGKAVRMGLARGKHADVVLASGLSAGPHLVTLRKEGEPYFGTLQFANPKLDAAGRWQTIVDDDPIVEVLSDSGATGICALGPDSPADAVSVHTSAWASETDSWVGLLEAGLAAVGHPVDMVNLAESGSTTESEAASYDYTAPEYNDSRFAEYSQPGRRHASVALLWGGANDHHGGGDVASGLPVAYGNLSRFQRGVFDQLTQIFARNPTVRVVLLQYIDSTIPEWTAAYKQVQSLFPEALQEHMFLLKIHDPNGQSDACEIDPKGHPNASMHASWAGQILNWMMSPDVLRQLGLPVAEQWTDE